MDAEEVWICHISVNQYYHGCGVFCPSFDDPARVYLKDPWKAFMDAITHGGAATTPWSLRESIKGISESHVGGLCYEPFGMGSRWVSWIIYEMGSPWARRGYEQVAKVSRTAIKIWSFRGDSVVTHAGFVESMWRLGGVFVVASFREHPSNTDSFFHHASMDARGEYEMVKVDKCEELTHKHKQTSSLRTYRRLPWKTQPSVKILLRRTELRLLHLIKMKVILSKIPHELFYPNVQTKYWYLNAIRN